MSLTIPNLLSLLRMGLVPLFIIAVRYDEPKKALSIFILAGITDALDGFIARIFRQQSLLGTYLDPIADKLLLTSAWVMLSLPLSPETTPIPLWVTILIIARDVLILIMALVLYLALSIRRFPPTVFSKVTTVVQVAAVVTVMVARLAPELLPRLADGLDTLADFLVYLSAALAVGSGLDYILRAGRLAETKDGAAA
jgi:cardiolipin synthase (CMP-forming)